MSNPCNSCNAQTIHSPDRCEKRIFEWDAERAHLHAAARRFRRWNGPSMPIDQDPIWPKAVRVGVEHWVQFQNEKMGLCLIAIRPLHIYPVHWGWRLLHHNSMGGRHFDIRDDNPAARQNNCWYRSQVGSNQPWRAIEDHRDRDNTDPRLDHHFIQAVHRIYLVQRRTQRYEFREHTVRSEHHAHTESRGNKQEQKQLVRKTAWRTAIYC